ncbi:MAG TPA: hypothetical protein ENO08_01065, partial [Candidatus Eisenbacteria bacterium]|nr:hypothetical protein [Candidatus Eisenbacteria bacterium]
MNWTGIDTVFTGAAGTLSYFLLALIAAFVYCARTAASKGKGAVLRAALGFALLLSGRLMHFGPLFSIRPETVLAAQILATAGLYFILQSVFAARGEAPGARQLVMWGSAAGLFIGGGVFLAFAGTGSTGAALPMAVLFLAFVPAGMIAREGSERGEILPIAAGAALLAGGVIA